MTEEQQKQIAQGMYDHYFRLLAVNGVELHKPAKIEGCVMIFVHEGDEGNVAVMGRVKPCELLQAVDEIMAATIKVVAIPIE